MVSLLSVAWRADRAGWGWQLAGREPRSRLIGRHAASKGSVWLKGHDWTEAAGATHTLIVAIVPFCFSSDRGAARQPGGTLDATAGSSERECEADRQESLVKLCTMHFAALSAPDGAHGYNNSDPAALHACFLSAHPILLP